MHTTIVSNRHTAGSGIHGEWSNKTSDRPIKKSEFFLGAVAMGAMFLAMCVGAAYGF